MSDQSFSIRTTDVGSFPLAGVDIERYNRGAVEIEDDKRGNDAQYFIEQHNSAFQRKFEALGPEMSVPGFVQSSYKRDMLSQFLDPIIRKGSGLLKQDEKYFWSGEEIQLPASKAQIAELIALREGAKAICENFNIARISYRACVTGPFEMMIRLWREKTMRIIKFV